MSSMRGSADKSGDERVPPKVPPRPSHIQQPTSVDSLDENCSRQGFLWTTNQEWKRTWINCTKYSLMLFNYKTDPQPVQKLNTIALVELNIVPNPEVKFKTNFKCFELSSPNVKLLFGVQTDNEKDDWILYFQEVNKAIIKKVKDLREKFAIEKRGNGNNTMNGNDMKPINVEKMKSESDIARLRSKTNPDAMRNLTTSPPPQRKEVVLQLEAPAPKSPPAPKMLFQGPLDLKVSQVTEWQAKWAIVYDNKKVVFYPKKGNGKGDNPDWNIQLHWFCPIAQQSSTSHQNCVAFLQPNSMCVVSLPQEDYEYWFGALTTLKVEQSVDMLMANAKFFTAPPSE